MRTIAKEYGRSGICADSVCPGLVIPEPDAIGGQSLWQADIKMGPAQIADIESSAPLRTRPEAIDIAIAAVFLSSAPPARMLTGQVLFGGFQMPR